MKNYQFNNLSYKNGLDKLKIPKFQRGLVWNKAKKESLLQTIHRGFPFGALLVSNFPNQDMLLLDGQQRLSTIREYEQNKFKYWKKLNPGLYDNLKNDVNHLINNPKYFVDDKDLQKLSRDNYDLGLWTDSLDELSLNRETKSELRKLINDAKQAANQYIDLDTLQIPVIEYTGPQEYLPDVFENLNKGGVPLSKYEVFSASWNNILIELPVNQLTNEILNYVKEYYRDLQDEGEFEFSDFSEDDLNTLRKIDLAEFARAFGKFTVSRLKSLVPKPEDKTFKEIGYGLLAIIVGVPNSRIMDIQKHQAEIQDSLNHILNETEYIANNLDSIFIKLLYQNINGKSGKKHKYSTGLYGSFKILSYFAATWDVSESEFQQMMKNIPCYYIYDYLNQTWTAHGDSTLNDFYPQNRQKSYLKPIDKQKFINAFNKWIDEHPRPRKTFSKEIQALITIHSNLTYLSTSLPYGEDFEFEHIIPKAWIVDKNNTAQPTHLSSLGNGMFLPKTTNNRKKDHTLYEYPGYNTHYYQKFISDALYPSEIEFTKIQEWADNNKYVNINEFIDHRAKKVAEAITEALF
jgi:hypothetical protein